jgi:hypothetical protein
MVSWLFSKDVAGALDCAIEAALGRPAVHNIAKHHPQPFDLALERAYFI